MEFATLQFKNLFLNSNSSESLLPHLPPPSACFFRPSVMALDISGLSACSFTFPFTPVTPVTSVTPSLPTIPPNTIWSSAALLMEDGSCEEGGGPESGSSWSLEPEERNERRKVREGGGERWEGRGEGGKGRGEDGREGERGGEGREQRRGKSFTVICEIRSKGLHVCNRHCCIAHTAVLHTLLLHRQYPEVHTLSTPTCIPPGLLSNRGWGRL